MEYKSNARFHSLAGLLIVACGTSSTPDDTNGSSTTEVGSSSGVFTTSDTGTSGNTSSTGATSSSEAGSESTSGGVAGLGCGDTVVPIPVFADAEGAPADGRVLGLGDLDGDAQLDALLLAPGASPGIILGSSEGWGDVETISEVTALAVAMGDLNGDQVLDLAVVTTAEHALVTLVGAGDGTFAVADMVDLGGAVPLGVVLLDADADGDEDLFVSADGSTMFAQNEDGFSTLATVELEGAAPLFNTGDLAVGDLDGSPGEDVVVHGTFVLSSNADGSFSSIARLQTAGGHAAVGPFDDVGPSDIAIALLSDAPSGSGSIAIGLVAEGGVGDLVEALPACQWCVRDKPSAADVNADGAIDLVYPSLDGVGVLLGCGDGAFAEPLHIGMERTLFRVHVIDVDQDGRPDLVSSTVAPNGELVVARGLE